MGGVIRAWGLARLEPEEPRAAQLGKEKWERGLTGGCPVPACSTGKLGRESFSEGEPGDGMKKWVQEAKGGFCPHRHTRSREGSAGAGPSQAQEPVSA